ncbi:GtrA family protein [Neobacillus sp. SM06]|uniref:GtrA family protein n=1 Tax=Neobacillus sp. SM06 TaxID=3422492 RepID=UPI003D288475
MLQHSFVRFLLVGVVNTIVGLSAMYFFLHGLSFSYWTATFIGNSVGAVVSYFLNRTFTFKSSTAVGKSMFRFVAVILACYFLSYYLGEKLAIIVLQQLPLISDKYAADAAVLVGTGIYTISNYLGQRMFVFGENKRDRPQMG